MSTLVVKTILSLALFTGAISSIHNNMNIKTIKNNKKEYDPVNSELLMKLEIPVIGVYNNVYKKDSVNNNIDRNVIIMNESALPDEVFGNVILGAHSGSGPLAYFKDFDKLKIGDDIYIDYDNTRYNYKIKYIYDDNKDGKIKIRNYGIDAVTLYTCKPNDKNNFLVIVAYKTI